MLKTVKKEGCFRDGVNGWRCRWCELLFPKSMAVWYVLSTSMLRDVSVFGLGSAVVKLPVSFVVGNQK